MLFLLTVLTAGYFAAVLWVRRSMRRLADESGRGGGIGDGGTVADLLPEPDRPPSTAKGWPPSGQRFDSYVDDGFAALDAYLQKGFAA